MAKVESLHSNSICVRYRLRRRDGEGIVKAPRPAEGEGGDVFSLFRLSRTHQLMGGVYGV